MELIVYYSFRNFRYCWNHWYWPVITGFSLICHCLYARGKTSLVSIFIWKNISVYQRLIKQLSESAITGAASRRSLHDMLSSPLALFSENLQRSPHTLFFSVGRSVNIEFTRGLRYSIKGFIGLRAVDVYW